MGSKITEGVTWVEEQECTSKRARGSLEEGVRMAKCKSPKRGNKIS